MDALDTVKSGLGITLQQGHLSLLKGAHGEGEGIDNALAGSVAGTKDDLKSSFLNLLELAAFCEVQGGRLSWRRIPKVRESKRSVYTQQLTLGSPQRLEALQQV